MNDSLDQAVDRMQYAVNSQPDTRILFLVGSGVSYPAIPATTEMLAFFAAELGGFSEQLSQQLAALTGPAAYQLAAKQLKQRRGDRGLAAAIRKAVLRAYGGSEEEPELRDELWDLPSGQVALARFISGLPPQRRGPVFTTNFDPLTEIALRMQGVPVAAVATPASQAFPVDQIYESLPVVHLHGYWQQSATLSTVAQLERPRPGVEDMLQAQFRNALLIVLGYGGWNDAFTRALSKVVSDGRMAALESEVLWMNYGDESSERSDTQHHLDGSAGVNEYFGIDAAELLSRTADVIRRPKLARASFLGWTSVPARSEIGTPSVADLIRFTEGAQPNWAAAATLPELQGTQKANAAINREYPNQDGDRVVVLMGPTGEGKSLGLRQAALRVSMNMGAAVVLYREPGAPRISHEWLQHVRSKSDISYLFIDEADLVLSDVVREVNHEAGPGRVVWVLAMHSHYRERMTIQTNSVSDMTVIDYGGLPEPDVKSVAKAWLELGLLPDEFSDSTIDEVSEIIRDAGHSAIGSSLFGAALHLWMGDDLHDRVDDLVRRLNHSSIRGRGFGWLLQAIAYVQGCDPSGLEQGEGISRAALGALCDLKSDDVAALIIAPLGREVGLSEIDDRVFVRHSAIAAAIVENLRRDDESYELARSLGLVGGTMRTGGHYVRSQSHCLSMLAARLTANESLGAARGLVEGSPKLLESRVTYLATQRRRGEIQSAAAYAKLIATKLDTYRDRRSAERGFWVEYANIENGLGHLGTAIGFASKSLSDLSGSGYISENQLRYGLVNTAHFTRKLSTSPAARALNSATMDLLTLIPGASSMVKGVTGRVPSSSSIVMLTSEFRVASQPFSKGIAQVGDWTFQMLLSAMSTTTSAS